MQKEIGELLAPPGGGKCDSESETSSGFDEDETDDVGKKPSPTPVAVSNVIETVQVGKGCRNTNR